MAAEEAGGGVRAAVWVHLDVAPPPRIRMLPGQYSSRERLASIAISGAGVDLYVLGDPGQLRAWADRVTALADEMELAQ